jgi:CRISPR type I-E-associated protein CasB/Cse2
MSHRLWFSKNSAAAKILLGWHGQLAEHDRGGRAALRRAADPEAAVTLPAALRLLRRLEEHDEVRIAPGDHGAVTAVAALAARVEENDRSASLGTQMAGSRPGLDRPRVSVGRFRRLLESDELGDRFSQLSRIVRLLERRANLLDLADAVCFWDSGLRRRWAYDYYAIADRKRSKEESTS